jgi:hypothetical protein
VSGDRARDRDFAPDPHGPSEVHETSGSHGSGVSRPPADEPRTTVRGRIEMDQENVERSLVALVLTLVELLRQLMERQAIRRLDAEDLDEEQIERVGSTLMALEERMTELREHFGLSVEDLNIDLGPLGKLLPDP